MIICNYIYNTLETFFLKKLKNLLDVLTFEIKLLACKKSIDTPNNLHSGPFKLNNALNKSITNSFLLILSIFSTISSTTLQQYNKNS